MSDHVEFSLVGGSHERVCWSRKIIHADDSDDGVILENSVPHHILDSLSLDHVLERGIFLFVGPHLNAVIVLDEKVNNFRDRGERYPLEIVNLHADALPGGFVDIRHLLEWNPRGRRAAVMEEHNPSAVSVHLEEKSSQHLVDIDVAVNVLSEMGQREAVVLGEVFDILSRQASEHNHGCCRYPTQQLNEWSKKPRFDFVLHGPFLLQN